MSTTHDPSGGIRHLWQRVRNSSESTKGLGKVLERIERAIVLVTFSGIIILVGVQVLGRTVLPPLSWTVEVSQYLLVWLVFMGASLGVINYEYVHLRFFVDRLPTWAAATMGVLAKALFLLFELLLSWVALQMLALQRMAGQTTITFPYRVPMYLISSVIPLSAALASVHLIIQLL